MPTTVTSRMSGRYGQQGKPHYHVAILLNRDAFCSLGHFQPGRDNLFNRLVSAWGSALGLTTIRQQAGRTAGIRLITCTGMTPVLGTLFLSGRLPLQVSDQALR